MTFSWTVLGRKCVDTCRKKMWHSQGKNKLGASTHRVRNGVWEDGRDPAGVETILEHPIPDTVGGQTQLVRSRDCHVTFFFCRCRRTFCRAQSKSHFCGVWHWFVFALNIFSSAFERGGSRPRAATPARHAVLNQKGLSSDQINHHFALLFVHSFVGRGGMGKCEVRCILSGLQELYNYNFLSLQKCHHGYSDMTFLDSPRQEEDKYHNLIIAI